MPKFTAVCSSTQSAAFSFITSVSKEHLRHKVDRLGLQQISKSTPRCPHVLLTPSPRGPHILGPHPHGETADIVPIPAGSPPPPYPCRPLRQTPHDDIGRAYASHRAAKTYVTCVVSYYPAGTQTFSKCLQNV